MKSLIDNLIISFDCLFQSSRAKYADHPGSKIPEANLTPREKQEVIKMLRVNHTGEVCAQALYMGQALTANKLELKQHLATAAAEEKQHLSWCRNRLKELNGRTSILNPFFAASSLALGACAGLKGEAKSLGFIIETEKQVTEHLTKQLHRIPAKDKKSVAILEQMRQDETKHADEAILKGGTRLSPFLTKIMAAAAKVMTTSTQYI